MKNYNIARLEELRQEMIKTKWLKNQDLAVIPYVGLISMLNDPENPLPLMHKSINDIETSINLSYQGSDAGAY